MRPVRYWKLPKWAPMAAITLGHHIWIKYPDRAALRAHELKHVEQVEDAGFCRFYWRYLVSRRWRTTYEAEAYAVSIRLGDSTIEQAARQLSSWLYLKPCSYEVALATIELALRAAADKAQTA